MSIRLAPIRTRTERSEKASDSVNEPFLPIIAVTQESIMVPANGRYVVRNYNELMELFQKVKDGQGNNDQVSRFKILFGPDPNCPDWKSHRHNLPPIYDLYAVGPSATPEQFVDHRLDMLKAFMHFTIYNYLIMDVVFKFYSLAKVLFHPDDARVSASESVLCAAFRADVIWPIFGSTQAFLEAMQDVYHQAEGSIFQWPRHAPKANCSKVRDEFRAAGDHVAAKLMDVVLVIEGQNYSMGEGTSNSMTGVDLLRNDSSVWSE